MSDLAARTRPPRDGDARRPVDTLASDVDGRVVVEAGGAAATDGVRPARRGPGLRPGWQIGLFVAGAPLWWLAGISDLMLPLLSLPLAWQLCKRRVRVPPGFWIWLLFVAWVAVSVLMMEYPVPNTASSDGIGRYIAFAVRLAQYVAVTLILLYVGNTTERELPRRRVMGWVAWLGAFAVGLGVAAVAFPHWGVPTLMSHLLPGMLVQGDGIAHLAQVQDVLGDPSPRPAAPFEYTNEWGSVLSMCLVMMVVVWGKLGSLGKRVALCAVLAVAALPIVYSLNRAMWLGLALAGGYAVVRLALRGKLLTGFISLLTASVLAVAFVVSPLGALVAERFENPHSNEVRAALADAAWNAAESSPIIGAGSTRNTIGSEASIAIGPRPDCPRCGYRVIGSTGQFWMLLIAQGFIGVLFYISFLARVLWTYRRDGSPLGIAASLVIALHLFYCFFYGALAMPLTIVMLAVGLLWRNERTRASSGSPGDREPQTVDRAASIGRAGE